ncbi:hypothetical protein FocTR4_00015167 [Fusarium oxysporum f. sp. cubense]|uniref:Uncharacterized protein n=1 Tax=Fusarium oxysporum f. sp. cubense TaxID=61366 RepID=A0A5C6SV06_FUSOC|nr:hypothetical protein FocTR4_00015167 [Fusarium oxysporum f. sp. cubense]
MDDSPIENIQTRTRAHCRDPEPHDAIVAVAVSKEADSISIMDFTSPDQDPNKVSKLKTPHGTSR